MNVRYTILGDVELSPAEEAEVTRQITQADREHDSHRRTIEVDVSEGTYCANQAVQCFHRLWQHRREKPYACAVPTCQCQEFVLS